MPVAVRNLGAPATDNQLRYIESLAKERGKTVTFTQTPSRKVASDTIAQLLALPKLPQPKAAPGYYVRDEEVFVVVENRSKTGTYAKKLVVTDNRGKWAYAPGVGATLAGLEPLTASVAADLGRQYGVCVVCGRTLSDPESVQRGIGPVCITKL